MTTSTSSRAIFNEGPMISPPDGFTELDGFPARDGRLEQPHALAYEPREDRGRAPCLMEALRDRRPRRDDLEHPRPAVRVGARHGAGLGDDLRSSSSRSARPHPGRVDRGRRRPPSVPAAAEPSRPHPREPRSREGRRVDRREPRERVRPGIASRRRSSRSGPGRWSSASWSWPESLEKEGGGCG